MKLAQYNQ